MRLTRPQRRTAGIVLIVIPEAEGVAPLAAAVGNNAADVPGFAGPHRRHDAPRLFGLVLEQLLGLYGFILVQAEDAAAHALPFRPFLRTHLISGVSAACLGMASGIVSGPAAPPVA
jgi:hypothetical protein